MRDADPDADDSDQRRNLTQQEREVASAIMAYLAAHPRAMDTLEGIAQWWLLRYRPRVEPEALARALEALTRNHLVEVVGPPNAPCYCLKGAPSDDRMAKQETEEQAMTPRRPLNVFVRKDSSAEKAVRQRSGLPGKPALPPGISATPEHDLREHGGRTIADLHYFNFFVGGDGWQQGDIDHINQSLAAAMTDPVLNDIMAQYFHGSPIRTTAEGSATLPGPGPALVSQGDVEKLLADLFTGGQLPALDFASTVFNFLLPPGTILNTDTPPTGNLVSRHASARPGAADRQDQGGQKPVVPKDDDDSLGGLGGYHGSIHTQGAQGNPQALYYAVGVFSEKRGDGSVNGIVAFDQPWKNVVATFYHELNEARTDADVEDAINAGSDPAAVNFLGWTSDQGEECGDVPVFEANPLSQVFQEVPLADGSGTVPIQFQYSNRAHGPEVPGSAGSADGGGGAGGSPTGQPTAAPPAATADSALIDLLANPPVSLAAESFDAIAAETRKRLRAAMSADRVHLNDVRVVRTAVFSDQGRRREVVLVAVESSGDEPFRATYVAEGKALLAKRRIRS